MSMDEDESTQQSQDNDNTNTNSSSKKDSYITSVSFVMALSIFTILLVYARWKDNDSEILLKTAFEESHIPKTKAASTQIWEKVIMRVNSDLDGKENTNSSLLNLESVTQDSSRLSSTKLGPMTRSSNPNSTVMASLRLDESEGNDLGPGPFRTITLDPQASIPDGTPDNSILVLTDNFFAVGKLTRKDKDTKRKAREGFKNYRSRIISDDDVKKQVVARTNLCYQVRIENQYMQRDYYKAYHKLSYWQAFLIYLKANHVVTGFAYKYSTRISRISRVTSWVTCTLGIQMIFGIGYVTMDDGQDKNFGTAVEQYDGYDFLLLMIALIIARPLYNLSLWLHTKLPMDPNLHIEMRIKRFLRSRKKGQLAWGMSLVWFLSSTVVIIVLSSRVERKSTYKWIFNYLLALVVDWMFISPSLCLTLFTRIRQGRLPRRSFPDVQFEMLEH